MFALRTRIFFITYKQFLNSFHRIIFIYDTLEKYLASLVSSNQTKDHNILYADRIKYSI